MNPEYRGASMRLSLSNEYLSRSNRLSWKNGIDKNQPSSRSWAHQNQYDSWSGSIPVYKNLNRKWFLNIIMFALD